MARKFISTAEFDKQWSAMGLTDEELRFLQCEILSNPKVGPVIPGTGGLRKMRFAFNGQGKSGSSRVCYVVFVIKETIYLITAYPKNEKDNLSKTERNQIKKLIDILGQSL